MPLSRIAAIILLVLGTIGLIYGGFSYTTDTHEAGLGPLSVSIDETEHVNLPVWISIAGIVIGAGLLIFPKKM